MAADRLEGASSQENLAKDPRKPDFFVQYFGVYLESRCFHKLLEYVSTQDIWVNQQNQLLLMELKRALPDVAAFDAQVFEFQSRVGARTYRPDA